MTLCYQQGTTPRKTALLQLCFRTQLTRAAASDDAAPYAASSACAVVGQQAANAVAPRHTCLLLHIAHTGITPALTKLLGSEQVSHACPVR